MMIIDGIFLFCQYDDVGLELGYYSTIIIYLVIAIPV